MPEVEAHPEHLQEENPEEQHEALKASLAALADDIEMNDEPEQAHHLTWGQIMRQADQNAEHAEAAWDSAPRSIELASVTPSVSSFTSQNTDTTSASSQLLPSLASPRPPRVHGLPPLAPGPLPDQRLVVMPLESALIQKIIQKNKRGSKRPSSDDEAESSSPRSDRSSRSPRALKQSDNGTTETDLSRRQPRITAQEHTELLAERSASHAPQTAQLERRYPATRRKITSNLRPKSPAPPAPPVTRPLSPPTSPLPPADAVQRPVPRHPRTPSPSQGSRPLSPPVATMSPRPVRRSEPPLDRAVSPPADTRVQRPALRAVSPRPFSPPPADAVQRPVPRHPRAASPSEGPKTWGEIFRQYEAYSPRSQNDSPIDSSALMAKDEDESGLKWC
jgi:hypothetical protein